MHESLANLLTNFCLIRANRLDVFLIEHDVGRTGRQVKEALPGGGHAVKDAQKQASLLSGTWGGLVRREILDQNCDVVDTAAELFRQRIQSLFRHVDEVLALHRSAGTQTARGCRMAPSILFIVATRIIVDASPSSCSRSCSSGSSRRRASAPGERSESSGSRHGENILLMSTWYSVPDGKSCEWWALRGADGWTGHGRSGAWSHDRLAESNRPGDGRQSRDRSRGRRCVG